jgi:hypothetical protein
MLAMPSTIILTLVAAVSGTASRDMSGCRVEFVPPEPSPAWAAAADALDSELRRAIAPNRDCSKIVVRTNGDHPTVAVFVSDGRQAVRPLGSANDLGPTVQGLIITIFPERQTSLESAPVDSIEVAASAPASIPKGKPHPLLVAAGGGRLSFPGTLPAVLVDVMGGLTFRGWELGVSGSYSPGLPAASSLGSPDTTQPSFALGANVGRRQRWRSTDLIVGARAGAIRTSTPVAYQINCTGTAGPQCTDDPTGAPSAQYFPFVGALAGLALWPTSFIRFRPQFLFEWLPTTARFLGASASSGSAVPGWSLTLSLGAESGAL